MDGEGGGFNVCQYFCVQLLFLNLICISYYVFLLIVHDDYIYIFNYVQLSHVIIAYYIYIHIHIRTPLRTSYVHTYIPTYSTLQHAHVFIHIYIILFIHMQYHSLKLLIYLITSRSCNFFPIYVQSAWPFFHVIFVMCFFLTLYLFILLSYNCGILMYII